MAATLAAGLIAKDKRTAKDIEEAIELYRAVFATLNEPKELRQEAEAKARKEKIARRGGPPPTANYKYDPLRRK